MLAGVKLTLSVEHVSVDGVRIVAGTTGASKNWYGPAKSTKADVKLAEDLVFIIILVKGGLQLLAAVLLNAGSIPIELKSTAVSENWPIALDKK